MNQSTGLALLLIAVSTWSRRTKIIGTWKMVEPLHQHTSLPRKYNHLAGIVSCGSQVLISGVISLRKRGVRDVAAVY